ncbi:hypothetical protein [Amycolatopsis sp. cmx-11-12]|uniref:hypothetical protein n=1 Tax=Amycolatopsis sp. cmx-11-12 TaxID=2785795 RepID=UPI003917C3B3
MVAVFTAIRSAKEEPDCVPAALAKNTPQTYLVVSPDSIGKPLQKVHVVLAEVGAHHPRAAKFEQVPH